MSGEANIYEARGRATKAFKLSRVWSRDVLPANRALAREGKCERLTLADIEAAGPKVRERVAELAGVKAPSDATWAAMVAILREQARRR